MQREIIQWEMVYARWRADHRPAIPSGAAPVLVARCRPCTTHRTDWAQCRIPASCTSKRFSVVLSKWGAALDLAVAKSMGREQLMPEGRVNEGMLGIYGRE